jgi:hypothetical protein
MKPNKQSRVITKPSDMALLGQQLRAHLEGGPVEVRWRRPESQRSIEQNDRMWAMLTDVSEQVNWYGTKLEPEEWKDVFTASLKQQRAVPGIDGGFVILGARTSKMSIKAMCDLTELMFAFGADTAHPVRWSDPNLKSLEQTYGVAA